MDSGSDFMRNFKPPPFIPPENAETFKDIQYSSHGHVRQRLDLYLPKLGKPGGDSPLPLIVYMHGKHQEDSDRFVRYMLSLNSITQQAAHSNSAPKNPPGCPPASWPGATPSRASTTA